MQQIFSEKKWKKSGACFLLLLFLFLFACLFAFLSSCIIRHRVVSEEHQHSFVISLRIGLIISVLTPPDLFALLMLVMLMVAAVLSLRPLIHKSCVRFRLTKSLGKKTICR